MPRSMPRSSSPDYLYDYPLPSSSSSRPSSPFHPTSRYAPSTSKYSPSTRAADISRLLDPSYSSSHPSSAPTTVYVDHHGHLHDPDYRHFPPMPSPNAPKRSARASPIQRPRWELASPSDTLLDDDDDDDGDTQDACHPFQHAYPSSRRSSSLPRTHNLDFRPAYSPAYPTYDISPPTSFDSDDTVLAEDDASDAFDEKRCIVKRYSGRRAAKDKDKAAAVAVAGTGTGTGTADDEKSINGEYVPSHHHPEDVEERDSDDDYEDEADAAGNRNREWTPTCTQAMRRHWQAMSLRFRFGVFRAQRKVRRRVTGAT